GRVDVEHQRVAFSAPGRAGLEGGAVGHLHGDHVVVGVGIGLHRLNSFAGPVPTGLSSESGAHNRTSAEMQDHRRPGLDPGRRSTQLSAIIAVKLTSQVTLSSIEALPQNLHTRDRFWTKPARKVSSTPGSTGARNLASSIAM